MTPPNFPRIDGGEWAMLTATPSGFLDAEDVREALQHLDGDGGDVLLLIKGRLAPDPQGSADAIRWIGAICWNADDIAVHASGPGADGVRAAILDAAREEARFRRDASGPTALSA